MIEDELVGWHHWFDVLEFEQAPGVGDAKRGLVCCSPWGHKELDTTEKLKKLSYTHPRSQSLRVCLGSTLVYQALLLLSPLVQC